VRVQHHIDTVSEAAYKAACKSLEAARYINEKLEKFTPQRYHGISILPGRVPVLIYVTLSRDGLGGYTVRASKYDYYIVLLSELGIARAIRFSGRIDKLDVDKSFVIEKIKIEKSEKSKIGDLLQGVFITHGMIESANLAAFQMRISILMSFAKPYALLADGCAAIVPSPLSLCTYEEPYVEGGARILYLSPAIVMTILQSDAIKKKTRIFGKEITTYLFKGYMLCFDKSNLRKIGPFRVVLAEGLSADESLMEDRNANRLECFTGVFVFHGSRPFILSGEGGDDGGFFLIYSRAGFALDSQIIAAIGNIFKVKLCRLDKPISDKLQLIYPFIYADMQSVKNIYTKLSGLLRRSSLTIEMTISDDAQRGFIYEDESSGNLYHFTPPYVTASILREIRSGPGTLLASVKELEAQMEDGVGRYLAIKRIREAPELKAIVEWGRYSSLWAEAYSLHRRLAEEHKAMLLL